MTQVTYEGGEFGGSGGQHCAGLVTFAEEEGALARGEFQAVGALAFAGERGFLPHEDLCHVGTFHTC